MDKLEENIQYFEEIKKIIIKEKGKDFWEEFIRGTEQRQREYFIEGYKYAIQILEDGLIEEKRQD